MLMGVMKNETNVMQMIEGFAHGPNVIIEESESDRNCISSICSTRS